VHNIERLQTWTPQDAAFVHQRLAERWPNSSPTITVNAIIKVSATSLSTSYRNSLPAVSFVAGSDSAEF
jgi:hypothetical protein